MGGSRSGSALQCAVVTACSAGVFCFTGEQRLTNRLINIESGRLIRFQPACQRQSRGVRDHCLGRTRHRVSSGLRPAERSSARLKSPAAAQAVRPVLLCRALAVLSVWCVAVLSPAVPKASLQLCSPNLHFIVFCLQKTRAV